MSNSLTLADTTLIELDKSQSPSNDLLRAISTVIYGGAYCDEPRGALSVGDSSQIFDATNHVGNFANIILSLFTTGLTWNTDSLSASDGATVATHYLLSTTNVTTPLSNWSRMLINQFDGFGHLKFTNLDGANAQQFYILQVQ